MAYKTMNIKKVIDKAERNELCLPAIQRKYVWSPEQIEKLFDSLYQGYPIGTFLMWNVPNDQIDQYKFYSFLREFHQKNGNFNDLNPSNENREFTAVLDGQQRITSLFIALRGSYTIVKRSTNIVKHLYFNLTAFADIEDDKVYFKLLSKDEAKNDKEAAWVKVGDFLNTTWLSFTNTQNRNYDLLESLVSQHPQKDRIQNILQQGFQNNQRLIDVVERLIKMLQLDENISYYEVKGNEGLDTVTEIFIRINSGGKVLSKSDLLFSTVISRWEEGREKIDLLLQELNDMEYNLDTDFIMRTCLYLTGSPILFKVGNFNNQTVQKIIDAFEKDGDTMDIKTAILRVFGYLKSELGIHDKALKSKNVLIPLIYHVYRGGKLGDNSLEEVQKYIYISLLQKVFGSHGDSLLNQLRAGVTANNGAYKLKDEYFNFSQVLKGITDAQKKAAYSIDEEVLNSWLVKKGDEAFMVLSLIYGKLPHTYDSYIIDHLHPKHFFKKSAFADGEFEDIKGLIDTVPSLMLASAQDRELRKVDFPLMTYINTILRDRNVDVNQYMAFHQLVATDSLELLQFKLLFESRRDRIMKKLQDLLIQGAPNLPGGGVGEEVIGSEPINPAPNPSDDSTSTYDIKNDPYFSFLEEEEVENEKKLTELSENLKKCYLDFIPRGEQNLDFIYELVQRKFSNLCDDDFKCTHRKNVVTFTQPEWKHRVRGVLDDLKNDPDSGVVKLEKRGFWMFM